MFALVVLLVLVAAGAYFFPLKGTVILYTDSDYKFNLITSAECAEYFSVKGDQPSEMMKNVSEVYSVYAPLSVSWSDTPWFYYHVLTQEAYDILPLDEPPGKPEIILTLDSGDLLVRWSPQDRPGDQPLECEFDKVVAEKI
ncbi:hypothetical protein A3I58_01805 [Candidatus Peregrinibacteria bacterium RIFCSPLOWO2_02_FULL_39_10]|nr:MAG: hypothetical protein A3I58_01805 [Candidatus Peregrinibacteria bacterium RIFCSPLOWO2_02_FULL_39_10]